MQDSSPKVGVLCTLIRNPLIYDNFFSKIRLFDFMFFIFQILNRTNNIFELVTIEAVRKRPDNQRKTELMLNGQEDEGEKRLRLKGQVSIRVNRFCFLINKFKTKLVNIFSQMIYMDNWRLIMFLGTPVMPKLTSLISTGLYINDLSMHDFSR